MTRWPPADYRVYSRSGSGDSLRPDVTAAGRAGDSGCAGADYFPRFAVALRVAGFRRETAGGVGGAAFEGSRGTVQEKRCFPA